MSISAIRAVWAETHFVPAVEYNIRILDSTAQIKYSRKCLLHSYASKSLITLIKSKPKLMGPHKFKGSEEEEEEEEVMINLFAFTTL